MLPYGVIVIFYCFANSLKKHSVGIEPIGRFSKDNVTWKEDATARGIVWTQLPVLTSTSFGQGRVAFTTAFMLFSRREDNAKDLESFASEKGKILSLNGRNIFFRCIFYDFLWELPKSGAKKAAQKAATFQRCFDRVGFLRPGCFSISAKQKTVLRERLCTTFSVQKKKKLQKQFFLGLE